MATITEKLMEQGYNQGAATWASEQIALGNGTLDQYLFQTANRRWLGAKNQEYASYTGQSASTTQTTTITTRVRPNGSFSNYLAYGHIKTDGSFVRVGYPKDVLKPRYGESWGKQGGAQYEYEVSFDVPQKFPFAIVKVYKRSAVQHDSIEILYTPVVVVK